MEEQFILLVYDIEQTQIRNKVYEIAKDYGLESIQFSVFFGKLNRNMYEELFIKLQDKIKNTNSNILLVPIGNKEVKKIKSSGKPLSINQKDFMSFI